VLRDAHVIACEDTRVSAKLVRHFGLSTPLLRYDEHSARRARPQLMKRLEAGEAVALISDAGTPLVSDPGYKLVRDAIDAGINVTPLPGASSVLAALAVSGLPTDRFMFCGFLPPKQGARKKELGLLAAVDATLIILESPRRLAASLKDMSAVLGPRPAAVARELTKLYEEVRRGTLDDLTGDYASEENPKGEIVVVVAPPEGGYEAVDLDGLLDEALKHHSVREAAALVAGQTGLPKRRVYSRALELTKGDGHDG
jgi:16S rRNA (cytidine1402-2'-O)-methyltransferase